MTRRNVPQIVRDRAMAEAKKAPPFSQETLDRIRLLLQSGRRAELPLVPRDVAKKRAA